MNYAQYIRRQQARTIYSDSIAQKQRISQGCGSESPYAFRPLDSGVRTDILIGEFNTTPEETSTILGSANANCPVPPSPPPPPPPPATTIVADLAGITFTSGGGYFLSTFTFAPTNVITVGFINANASIGDADHIDFRRETLPNLTPSDTFTIANPTVNPFIQHVVYGPGNIYSQVYTNDTLNMTPSSIITFTSAETLSNIGLSISKN